MSNLLEFLKTHKEEIKRGVLVLLIAAASFGLGWLLRGETTHAPIIIEKNSR